MHLIKMVKKWELIKNQEKRFSMSRLQEQYKSEISKNLYSKLNCNNIHEVPKISKIVLNIGLGEAKDDAKVIDKAQEEL